MFTLSGIDASVTIKSRNIIIKRTSEAGVPPITIAADSILGAAVWTGLLTGQFSVHYGDASHTNTYQSVQFKAADKEWWDAMASAVMAAVARSIPATRSRSVDGTPADAVPAAPPTFTNWLNRTVGYEAQLPAAADAKPL